MPGLPLLLRLLVLHALRCVSSRRLFVWVLFPLLCFLVPAREGVPPRARNRLAITHRPTQICYHLRVPCCCGSARFPPLLASTVLSPPCRSNRISCSCYLYRFISLAEDVDRIILIQIIPFILLAGRMGRLEGLSEGGRRREEDPRGHRRRAGIHLHRHGLPVVFLGAGAARPLLAVRRRRCIRRRPRELQLRAQREGSRALLLHRPVHRLWFHPVALPDPTAAPRGTEDWHRPRSRRRLPQPADAAGEPAVTPRVLLGAAFGAVPPGDSARRWRRRGLGLRGGQEAGCRPGSPARGSYSARLPAVPLTPLIKRFLRAPLQDEAGQVF